MVFNATLNNASAISWRSVLLVEETGVPQKKTTTYWQTFSHNVVWVHLGMSGIWTQTIVVIGTDCIGSQGLLWLQKYRSQKKSPIFFFVANSLITMYLTCAVDWQQYEVIFDK